MAHLIKPPCDEGVILSKFPAAPYRQNARVWVLVATILGSSMAFIDSTVVNATLPTLQTNLKATVADVQWVGESYVLFVAALILLGRSLGDRFLALSHRKFILRSPVISIAIPRGEIQAEALDRVIANLK